MKLKNFGAALLIASTTLSSFASVAMAADAPAPNQYYWPKGVDLTKLRDHDSESNPFGASYYASYHKKFEQLDLQEVRKDIEKVMLTSQPWWPADYGNYGPFFIRMAWHNAGTYRAIDGRGGEEGAQQRFAQQNDWPDNASLDKAKRLLWPVKKKYGEKISWGDLIVLTGDVALNQMGFKTLGFAGGRPDDWQSELIYWGPGTSFFPNKASFQAPKGKLAHPLAATHMGLIYVNPEGPNGDPNPAKAAAMIRLAFGRMAMNDEETVALIAGGHTFGKAHGAHPNSCLSGSPITNGVEQQGLGWVDHCIKGKRTADDASTSGLEGAWSADPIHFTTQYIDNLLGNDWVLTKSPTGAHQWVPKDAQKVVPDAAFPGDASKMHPLMMFTTDIALKTDPAYRKIIQRWSEHPNEFADAFARAWFKLVVRDMGPKSRYFGSEVPKETFVWQDPIPTPSYKQINQSDIRDLKKQIAATGLSDRELIKTAWAAASSHRVTDHRGGANGGRLALMPQNGWAVNDPQELKVVLPKLEQIRDKFNSHHSSRQVSLADLIVLSGNVGLENAAKKAGVDIKVPFAAGRGDATQEQTDVASFNLLEPTADAFRNYYRADLDGTPPLKALVDKASTLNLTIPEMTVLLGGMRTLDVNTAHSQNGVLTKTPGALTRDFFSNVLTMDTRWQKVPGHADLFEGFDRTTGQKLWTATDVDLVFSANPELRAVAEVYASDDAKEKFYADFVKAWTKVMNLDRFDLQR